ncbi:Lipopolysaccharide heptosyltransferase 1 [Planctomycetales bacterium 10988]|nr:Lipopolysaccharide heptosyltransferase 1 [Planctomycetales bacterium 10988]
MPEPLDPKQVKNVLIVKMSSMGDVLHTFPSALALRKLFPKAHLAWTVEATHAGVLEGQAWLDETIIWKRRTSWAAWRTFRSQLNARKWDLAIDFQGLLRSGWITWLSGAEHRVGFSGLRERPHWFYNNIIPVKSWDCHAVERLAWLVEHLGGELDTLPIERPYLTQQPPQNCSAAKYLFPLCPQPSDRQAVSQWLQKKGFDEVKHRLVLLAPHCRREANRWPLARFANLADRLLSDSRIKVALLGGPGAKTFCDQIEASASSDLWRADGQFSLLGSAALMQRSDMLLTGDTGPMHLAAGMGLPMVVLFGATNPVRTGPYTSQAVGLNAGLSCSPCYAKKCPLGDRIPRCMQQIEVEEVYQAIRGQLHFGELPAETSFFQLNQSTYTHHAGHSGGSSKGQGPHRMASPPSTSSPKQSPETDAKS